MVKRITPPADLKQCECIKTYVNPWSLGGASRREERCHKKPRYIIYDKKTPDSQGVCGECKKEFERRNPDYKIVKIEGIK